MEIGIDDIDDFEGDVISPSNVQDDPTLQEPSQQEPQETPQDQEDVDQPEDFTTFLLKSRGIEDKTKIKFQNEDEEIEELDWDSLSNEDKLNVLNSSLENPETELDNSEIQLINNIRNSGLSPEEYVQYIQQQSINTYMQNAQQPQYAVDEYDDDELFIADFMSRMGDVTEEEAQEALERAKSNEALYTKQMGAIRNEYKAIEEDNLRQAQFEQEQEAQARYDEFAQSIEDEINNLTEYSGYDLNLEQDDMQELYDFITGQDAAGNNYFAKALADPKLLVQTAWLALNGQQMIEDITDYFQKEITQVRKESYKKGQEDAKNKMTNVVYKQSNRTNNKQTFDDLDDF